MWVGLGIMKTVAAPIFTKYKNNNTNANNKKRKKNLEEDLVAGGTDVGRTRHHEDCGRPNGILQSTETTIPTPITKKKESEP